MQVDEPGQGREGCGQASAVTVSVAMATGDMDSGEGDRPIFNTGVWDIWLPAKLTNTHKIRHALTRQGSKSVFWNSC